MTGLAVGAVAGGPIGAVIGAAVGAWTGDHYHKQVVARHEAEKGLTESETERTRLAQNVTELNGSLAQTQERGEQLDLALSHTDEVQTDVGFRTNDDSIQTQSLSPLMKLGALAAALPDAKVRVDGYADPRGSDGRERGPVEATRRCGRCSARLGGCCSGPHRCGGSRKERGNEH